MRSLVHARSLAVAAAAAGAALLGASLGGMTSVDRELRAATAPAPISQDFRVIYETRTGVRASGDCADGRAHRRDGAWQEL